MVLRTLILFSLLLTNTSFAKKNSKIYFIKAKKFQKKQDYSKSNYYYNKLLKSFYLKKHLKVIRAYKKKTVDDMELPKALENIYLNLGKNHYNLFRKRGNIQNAKKARMYIKVCDEIDFADECSNLLDKINAAISKNALLRKSTKFYIQAGRLLFQDRVEIKETASGITSSLVSNNSAACYGAGLRFGSIIKGWSFSGCAFNGITTVQGVATSESGTDYKYNQSGVPIAGMIVEGGYYYKFDEQNARLALSLPVMYRAGSYSEPSGYKITDSTKFYYGINFTAGLQLPIIELQMKLAHMQKTNSLLLNIVYTF